MARLLQYWSKFNDERGYKLKGPGRVDDFELWCDEHRITLEESYNYVNEWTDTLPITRKTKQGYRTVLRRLIEFVIEEESDKDGSE